MGCTLRERRGCCWGTPLLVVGPALQRPGHGGRPASRQGGREAGLDEARGLSRSGSAAYSEFSRRTGAW
ncbi:hypothetical protein J2T17_000684 [Paenibacillus mucilaginosus]|uniref:hypothetical protein n=1 Tax=Paenibacillus mucilaginosus TaxID=61624 RepID=UPI003D25E042